VGRIITIMNKSKVPYYLIAGQEPTFIEVENGGSNGYKGKWWDKIPHSPELGTTRYQHPVDGNPIRQEAFGKPIISTDND
jgi:hypothetical protein